jgi:hypothetical protein
MFAVPVAALGLVFLVLLVRELIVRKPLPPPPAQRASQQTPTATAIRSTSRTSGADLNAWATLSARSLFSPARSETSVAATAKVAGRPVLHGVVVDGPRSRAYIEDSLVKGVFGYTVGDTVGQGQITTISADRVTITGPEGTFEVLLNDPAKPKPIPGVTPAAPAQPRPPAVPVTPGVRRPIPGPMPGQIPGQIPGQQPGGPPATGRQSPGPGGQAANDDDD